MNQYIKMINKLPLFLLLFLLFACNSGEKEYTDDLAGKKEKLTDLKLEKKDLDEKITALMDEIKELDPNQTKDPINISSSKIQSKDFERFATIQASVIGDDLVSASSSIGGRILSLTVREGDYVSKGTRIATLDMETAEKQIAEVETSLGLAQTVYERQKRLWDQNIGSEIQYLQAKNNKEQIEKSLETLRSQTAKRYVYAPISGYIDREILKQGEMASPGMPIVQILNTNKLKVVADVPENFLGKVNRGDMVDIYFPALDQKMKKRVSMLGRSIDPSNRTFKIEIGIAANKNIKPNLLAEVEINDLNIKDAMYIPVGLIRQEVNGKQYVYTVEKHDGQMLAKKKYIQTGESDDAYIVITDGLEEGTEIIMDGAQKVAENDVVNIVETEILSDGE